MCNVGALGAKAMRLRRMRAVTWWSAVRGKPAKKTEPKRQVEYLISRDAVIAIKAESRQIRDS